MAFLATLTVSIALNQQSSLFTKDLLSVGSGAPSLSIEGTNGKISLNADKPALIVFWHLGSKQSGEVFDHLKGVVEKYENKIQILPINCGDDKSKVQDFLKSSGFKGGVGLVDPGSDSIIKEYGIKGYPTFYVVDRAGNIAFRDYKPEMVELDKAISHVIY